MPALRTAAEVLTPGREFHFEGVRLQQSFVHDYRDLYADQAHCIHSFRQITGFTPAKYARRFDV